MSVVVYKLGGSLLKQPDLSNRLPALVRESLRALVVVGGGALVDVVRGWDRTHGLGDELAHRLAVEAMGVTATMVAGWLGTETCSTRHAATTLWDSGRPAVLATPAFLELEEAAVARTGGLPLPRTWDVTSDSIAAWVAQRWPAETLVLLKSCDRNEGTWEGAASAGLVDPDFPGLAARIPVTRWVNVNASE